MIEELEKTEVSEREEEELKKQEMVDDLKMKEEQWSAIKQILTDFPKIQAEADQLKKEGKTGGNSGRSGGSFSDLCCSWC